MRMWMTDPSGMCRQHLLGEHVELHMLAATIRSGKSILGFLSNALVEPTQIASRHAALVAEMARRGMRHGSPLEQPPLGKWGTYSNVVSVTVSRAELESRCPHCYKTKRATTSR